MGGKKRAMKIDRTRFLRLYLHVQRAPFLPTLTHMQKTYSSEFDFNQISEPERSKPTIPLILTSHLPHEHKQAYLKLFQHISQEQRPFNITFDRVGRRTWTKLDTVFLRPKRSVSDELSLMREECYDALGDLDGISQKAKHRRAFTFSLRFRLLKGLDKKRAFEVVGELRREWGLGKGEGEGEGVEEGKGGEGEGHGEREVLSTRVVGLGLGAKYPDQFPEWKEDLYWGFNEGVKDEDERVV